MAASTNSTTTLVTIGNREDLEDTITRVAPEDTPFVSMAGTKSAKNTYHEWQTETLATPDATNASLEGNQNFQSIGAPNLTTRIGNRCQIFTKVGEVSGTQDAVDAAGRAKESTRQKMLKGLELKRDIEARAVGNYASNVESGATPRRMAGALAWLTSNVSRGAGGSSGGFSAGNVSAATNGTLRTFTETLVKTTWATAFGNGAKPTVAMMGGTLKQAFSAFTGIANIREDAGGKMATIVAGADVYVGDFGRLTLVPHPYALTRDALFINPKLWSMANLRPIFSEDLAKTGDADAFQIIGEKTLVSANEKGNFVVADIQ